MADRRGTDSAERVEVRRRMNDHGTMTVEVTASNEIRHLVAYESSSLQTTLTNLPEGSTVSVEMRRAGVRANVWRAVALRPAHDRRGAASPRDGCSTDDRTDARPPEAAASRAGGTSSRSDRTPPPSERPLSPAVTE
jgi:hypothetical protein